MYILLHKNGLVLFEKSSVYYPYMDTFVNLLRTYIGGMKMDVEAGVYNIKSLCSNNGFGEILIHNQNLQGVSFIRQDF